MENTNNKQNNINNNFKKISLQYKDRVYINHTDGIERPWVVEEVNTNTYEVFHLYGVAHIDVNKVYYCDENKRYKYLDEMPMMEKPGQEVKEYFIGGKVK